MNSGTRAPIIAALVCLALGVAAFIGTDNCVSPLAKFGHGYMPRRCLGGFIEEDFLRLLAYIFTVCTVGFLVMAAMNENKE